jgi:hypothetical protein
MDKKAVRKLWSRINQSYPEYRLTNRLLVRIPLGSILSGVLFDSSAFSKEMFYIDLFVQPLYVPSDHLVLNFGLRAPGQWDYKEPIIQELANRVSLMIRDQASAFHQTFGTPELFYRNIPAKFSLKDIYLHQALVFTAVHLGKIDEAQRHFETLHKLVTNTDPKIPWPRAVLKETECLVNEATRDSSRARDRLRQFEADTLKNLKLDDLPFVSDIKEK